MLSLDKLLEGLDINLRPFAICCAAPGTQLSLGPRDEATVHYVLAGHGVLSLPGLSPLDLHPGTMIVVPSGMAHELAGTGEASELPQSLRQCRPVDVGLEEIGQRVNELMGGIAMLCGSVDVTYRRLRGVFDYLPTPIVEQAFRGDVIWEAFESIVREMTNLRPGSAAMLRALFQQWLIELLRKYSESDRCQLPWLLALEDPRLNKAIDEIMERPGRPYTLGLLAEMCNMSRTTFAERFAASFGRSAMDFVKEIRLRDAARLLRRTDQPIKAIAANVGYDSRSHFSHAFKDFFGISPVDYRATQDSESRGMPVEGSSR